MTPHPVPSLAALPIEILLEISGYLSSTNLCAFALASRKCNEAATQILYQRYEYIYSNRGPEKALLPFLETIQHKKHLADLVKQVRIDERAFTPWKLELSQVYYAEAISKIEDATTRKFFRRIAEERADGDIWDLIYRFRLDGRPMRALSSVSSGYYRSEFSSVLEQEAEARKNQESAHAESQVEREVAVTDGDYQPTESLNLEMSPPGSQTSDDRVDQWVSDLDHETGPDTAEMVDGDDISLPDNVVIMRVAEAPSHNGHFSDAEGSENEEFVIPKRKKFWDYTKTRNEADDDYSSEDFFLGDLIIPRNWEKKDPEKPYNGMSMKDIAFYVQSYLEDLQLRAKSALLLVLCRNIEELHITVSTFTWIPSPYVFQPLVAAGARDMSRNFHGFPKLTTLTIDVSAYTHTSREFDAPLHDTEVYAILCIPTLRRVTLINLKMEFSDANIARWKRKSPSKSSQANFECHVTDLTLIRPYPNQWILSSLFAWLDPPLEKLSVRERYPAYMSARASPHYFFYYPGGSYVSYIDRYHKYLEESVPRQKLQEVHIDLADQWLINEWYLISGPLESDMYLLPSEAPRKSYSPKFGFWHAHKHLKKLTMMLPSLRSFLAHDANDSAFSDEEVFTHANVVRAANSLIRVFPESLEELVLLVDPEWICDRDNPLRRRYANALFSEEEPRYTCRGTPWCRSTWAFIWDLAKSHPHFNNLRSVILEFHRVESCSGLGAMSNPPLPRSGTRVALWPPSNLD